MSEVFIVCYYSSICNDNYDDNLFTFSQSNYYESEDEEIPELIHRKEYVKDKNGFTYKVGSSEKRVQDSTGTWYELDFEDGEAYVRRDDYSYAESKLR